MVRGGMVRSKLSVLLPFVPLLLSILPACVPLAQGSRAPIESAEPGTAPAASATADRTEVPEQALAHERELSAALQQLVDERTREVQGLRVEIKQLRKDHTDLRAALDRALAAANAGAAASAPSGIAGNGATQAATAAASEPSTAAAATAKAENMRRELEQQQAAATRLQSALAQEQQRREHVEAELSRLKQETSSPPYGDGQAGEAALAAAKREVVELRTALGQERAARQRLAQDFRALQQRAAGENAGPQNADAENSQLRSQLQQLEQEKRKITDSFNHSLAESQQRATELEEQLAQARMTDNAGAASGELTNIRAENAALRMRLDEEHRRTEELAAKLKTATRVTDLIFKMQAQGAAPASR
jgi:predicted RNase H-like nuclease (RuvC/YqgF family)